MSGKRTGKATVSINGVFIDTMKGVKLNPGGTKRTPVTSAHSVGYTEELMPSVLEFEKTQRAGDAMKDLDLADARITVEWDTGQTDVINNAFLTDPAQKTDDGKTAYVFNGDPAKEIL